MNDEKWIQCMNCNWYFPEEEIVELFGIKVCKECKEYIYEVENNNEEEVKKTINIMIWLFNNNTLSSEDKVKQFKNKFKEIKGVEFKEIKGVD